MKHLAKVDQYVEKNPKWSAVLTKLREIIAACGLEETIKWGGPTYTKDRKNLLGLGAFKHFAGIWFFQGALLKDPLGVLVNAQEGKTKALRQWRFAASDTVPADAVRKYIEETIENHHRGLSIKPAAPSKKPLVVPPELKEYFGGHPEVKSKFEAFNLTGKREFCEYIATAKRTETKMKRLEKVVALIETGESLYQKYK